MPECASVSDWRRFMTKACCWMQVPMLLVYMCVHRFYTRSYIELQRIDAVSTVSKPPLYPLLPGHASVCMTGVGCAMFASILPCQGTPCAGHSGRQLRRQAACCRLPSRQDLVWHQTALIGCSAANPLRGGVAADLCLVMCRSRARQCTAISQRAWRAWTPSAPMATRAALRS